MYVPILCWFDVTVCCSVGAISIALFTDFIDIDRRLDECKCGYFDNGAKVLLIEIGWTVGGSVNF